MTPSLTEMPTLLFRFSPHSNWEKPKKYPLIPILTLASTQKPHPNSQEQQKPIQ